MGLVALLVIAFAAAMGAVVSKPEDLLLGSDFGALKTALVLPVIAAVLTVVALFVAVHQWMTGSGSVATRVRHSLAVLVSIAVFWSLNTWNLLGWKF